MMYDDFLIHIKNYLCINLIKQNKITVELYKLQPISCIHLIKYRI